MPFLPIESSTFARGAENTLFRRGATLSSSFLPSTSSLHRCHSVQGVKKSLERNVTVSVLDVRILPEEFVDLKKGVRVEVENLKVERAEEDVLSQRSVEVTIVNMCSGFKKEYSKLVFLQRI